MLEECKITTIGSGLRVIEYVGKYPIFYAEALDIIKGNKLPDPPSDALVETIIEAKFKKEKYE